MTTILLLADTHLGFDLPARPRIERRRRGHDFFRNFERALEPARRGEVDLVVHGGDLLYRSRVPVGLVERAMAPLLDIAGSGIPVYLVPGNHERSRIPHLLWSTHPHLYIFDRPRTFVYRGRSGSLALAGFPFVRKVRPMFKQLLQETGYRQADCSSAILCTHLAFEGARVGVADYTFRHGIDVVRGSDIPDDLTAVLSGHIHRAQVLNRDLSGRPLGAPVFYPGSVERTSFVEREETKGFFILTIEPGDGVAGVRSRFYDLGARPMFVVEISTSEYDRDTVLPFLKSRISDFPPDAVVQVRFQEPPPRAILQTVTAGNLRAICPKTMNISLAGMRARAPS